LPDVSITGYCGDDICGIDEDETLCPEDCGGDICDFDLNCETDLGENYDNCPSDCLSPSTICDFDFKCDFGENYDNCPSDCEETTEEEPITTECSDEIDNDGDGLVDLDDPGCDYSGDDDETDEEETAEETEGGTIPDSEPERKKFPWWIIIILILFIGGIFYYYYAFKKPKEKKKKPIFQTNQFGQLAPLKKPTEQKKRKLSLFKSKPKPTTTFQKRSSKIDQELDKSIKEAKKLLKK